MRRARSALAPGAGDSGSCGAINHEGCCDGQTLYYCDAGVVLAMICSQNPSCGWDAAGSYYDCGTSGQPDPSGAHPKACAVVPDLGLQGCGNVTWEGCCHGQVLHYCENGLKTIDCSQSPSCGWSPVNSFYDCGTGGGADPSGTHPSACTFDAAVPDTGPVMPCGNVPDKGCCH